MKKALTVILSIAILIVGGFIAFEKSESNISKNDISEILGMEMDDFEITRFYLKKGSANKFSLKHYKEFLVADLDVSDMKGDINHLISGFDKCDKNEDVLLYLEELSKEDEHNLWLDDFTDNSINWYKREQLSEDKRIKSSVSLYLLMPDENRAVLILDQRNI